MVWELFGADHECSKPNPLMMAFADSIAASWGLASKSPTVVRPGADCSASGGCKPYIKVVYVARRKKPFSVAPVQQLCGQRP
jgi:hypothetical protein